MDKNGRFLIYDTELEHEVYRMSESEFRIYLAQNDNEELIKKFLDYQQIDID